MEDWLLDYLVCPVSRQRLQPAGEEVVARILARMETGLALPTDLDVPRVERWLVTEDGHRVYPVLAGIPCLVTDASLVL